MYEERTQYAPFVLFEYDHKPGTYCLMLSDNHMIEQAEIFESNGREPNGYGWADVALQAIRSEAPELEKKVEMDPEAGNFVAFGDELEDLQHLAEVLHAAYHDDDELATLVQEAPYEYD